MGHMKTIHTNPKYLVWKRSLGNLRPQLWYDDMTTGTGQRQHKAVGEDGELAAFQKLTEAERELSLDELAAKYPPDQCEYR